MRTVCNWALENACGVELSSGVRLGKKSREREPPV
jgi:hypothetical protein